MKDAVNSYHFTSPNGAKYQSQGCQPLVENIEKNPILAVLLLFLSATLLTKSQA
ncbi:hypothetical protein ADICYQ_2658 [Cyclobacterium qasimii M12-11B]|uniref:Uncharacterized protein n=1 Tax=Cyclobacterium qasimii M12-11B TaxID=641524 RepID=S7VEB3_9BACT|nr:hypothetical protein ADICYQ_2658 [Cyclobacterium qasimii M12-11B]